MDGGKIIVISGSINFGDDRRFANIAAQARNGIVFFNSPGGSLDAAIRIGKVIRVMGLVTNVADSDICVSACALAWLGGSARFMSPSAKVGFHAAYVDNLGEKEVSSVGNAIVGGYLNGFGFSENAIAYVTSPPPEKVRWLTFDDAAKVGIEVKRGLEPRPSAAGNSGAPSSGALRAGRTTLLPDSLVRAKEIIANCSLVIDGQELWNGKCCVAAQTEPYDPTGSFHAESWQACLYRKNHPENEKLPTYKQKCFGPWLNVWESSADTTESDSFFAYWSLEGACHGDGNHPAKRVGNSYQGDKFLFEWREIE